MQEEMSGLETFFVPQYAQVKMIRQMGGMANLWGYNKNEAQKLLCDEEEINSRAIICIDEGVPRRKTDFPVVASLLHLIYCNKNPLVDPWAEAIHICETTNADKLIGHDDCGGMKEVYRELFGEEEFSKLTSEKLNAFTRKMTAETAGRLSAKMRRTITAEHHPSSKMYRPNHHVATALYVYCPWGGFNPNNRFPNMPMGYLVRPPGYLYQDSAWAEANLAVQLGLGGYPDLLTEETPFQVYIIGDPGSKEFNAKKTLAQVKNALPDAFCSRVAFDAFDNPDFS